MPTLADPLSDVIEDQHVPDVDEETDPPDPASPEGLALHDAETAKLVAEMEVRVSQEEAEWESAHGHAATLKKRFEASQDELRRFIRSRRESRGVRPPKPAPTLFDGLTPDAAPPAAPDDLWTLFPLADERWQAWGLTAKDVEKFAAGEVKGDAVRRPVLTVGDVSAFTAPGASGFARLLTDIKGIGEAALERWHAAEGAFWAWWNAGGRAEFAAERGLTPVQSTGATEPSPPAEPVEESVPGGLPADVRGQGLALIGVPPAVIKKLDQFGEIATVGDLWDWVEEDRYDVGGMANDRGLWQCLKHVKVASQQIGPTVDAVYAFLKAKGCDPRQRREKSGESRPGTDKPNGVLGAEGDPSGWAGVIDPALVPAVRDLPLARIDGFPASVRLALEQPLHAVKTLGDLAKKVEELNFAGDLGEQVYATIVDLVGHEGFLATLARDAVVKLLRPTTPSPTEATR